MGPVPLAERHGPQGGRRQTASAGHDTTQESIQDGGARRGVASDTLSVGHDEVVVDGFEHDSITPPAEIAENAALGWQVRRDHPPRDVTAQEVENGVHDIPVDHAGRRPPLPGDGNNGLMMPPFVIRQVSFVP